MFGYNYKFSVVNSEKSIVKLTPTMGTYAKAMLPGLVAWGGLVIFGMIASKKSKENDPSFDEHSDESLKIVKD